MAINLTKKDGDYGVSIDANSIYGYTLNDETVTCEAVTIPANTQVDSITLYIMFYRTSGGSDGERSFNFTAKIGSKTYSASKTLDFTANGQGTSVTLKPSGTKYTTTSATSVEVVFSSTNGVTGYRYGPRRLSSSNRALGSSSSNRTCLNTSASNYTLTVIAGNYIKSVTGGGDYASGTKVSISATLASATGYNYSFSKWTSSGGGTFANSASASTTFTMPAANVTITATGTRSPKKLTITYYRNTSSSDTVTSTETFTYSGDDSAGNFGNSTTSGWTKTDYSQSKWTSNRDGSGTSWTLTSLVTDARINRSSPSLNVYLLWSVKQRPGHVVIFSSSTGKNSYQPYIYNGTSWVKYSAYYYSGGWLKTNIKATSVDN